MPTIGIYDLITLSICAIFKGLFIDDKKVIYYVIVYSFYMVSVLDNSKSCWSLHIFPMVKHLC